MKTDNRSKSYQQCESSEKLNKKEFFIQKQMLIIQTKVAVNNSIYTGFKGGLIGSTAFLDLVYNLHSVFEIE
jgi:hypothetical protein